MRRRQPRALGIDLGGENAPADGVGACRHGLGLAILARPAVLIIPALGALLVLWRGVPETAQAVREGCSMLRGCCS